MDNEVISILNEIKIAIYILMVVVILGVVANWIRAGVSVKNLIRREIDDLFTEEASNYYDEGEFDKLISHCKEKLNKKPNHSYALWYKAKAYYQKQDYEKSKHLFENLAITEPSWSESHVQPYLERIAAIENENR